jgi:hypothetical protein
MSTGFFIVAAISALGLAGLLFWAFRGASERKSSQHGLGALESAPQHLRNMGQIRQAMDSADLQYVRDRGGSELASRLRNERRKVTLLYLAAIRRDFEQSLRIARIIAVLSPEVSGSHEYERLRLSIVFRFRYQIVRLGLLVGSVRVPQVTMLGQMATTLAIQMEESMSRLGERAALAAELALQSDQ